MTDERPPDCLGPRAIMAKTSWTLPTGAWDTHFHTLGPQERFPYSPTRKYTPPDAGLGACLAFHTTLGIERGVAVHANTHGFDNAAAMDAVAGSEGRYLGVVRLDRRADRARCVAMDRAGIRGVRFAFNPQHGGSLELDTFNHVLGCIAGLGWFVELHFSGSALPELRTWIESIPEPVVIDHMGRIDLAAGLDQRPVEILLTLARSANIWIKISGADRLTRRGPPYADVVPLAHALIDRAPDRIIWGSDWPHTGFFDRDRMPDDVQLLDALATFAPDEEKRRRILVDNPLQLFGRGLPGC